jgi:hypothetical protein
METPGDRPLHSFHAALRNLEKLERDDFREVCFATHPRAELPRGSSSFRGRLLGQTGRLAGRMNWFAQFLADDPRKIPPLLARPVRIMPTRRGLGKANRAQTAPRMLFDDPVAQFASLPLLNRGATVEARIGQAEPAVVPGSRPIHEHRVDRIDRERAHACRMSAIAGVPGQGKRSSFTMSGNTQPIQGPSVSCTNTYP